jgi:hypothetical protein
LAFDNTRRVIKVILINAKRTTEGTLAGDFHQSTQPMPLLSGLKLFLI